MNKIIFNDATSMNCITDIPEQTMVEVKGKGVKAIIITVADSLMSIKKAFTDTVRTSLIKIRNEDTGVVNEYSGYTNLVSISYDPSVSSSDEVYIVTMSLPVDIESLINSISNTIEDIKRDMNSTNILIENHSSEMAQFNMVTENLTLGMSNINKDIQTINENTVNLDDNISKINTSVSELKNSTDDSIKDIYKNIDNMNQETDKTTNIFTNKINDITDKINEITAVPDINSMSLEEAKEYKINQSKITLEEFLAANPITSSCHGKTEKRYSITSDKQQYLSMMIMMTSLAVQKGIEYQPSWNATGEACTYDWTLDELQQLAIEIETVVRPLISKQQKIEKEIKNCTTIDEVKNITFDYVI